MTTLVIGAGIGGLSAAITLAAAGEAVTVLERQNAVGGKLRPLMIGGEAYDGCATVMTMRWVFEELFALAGADFTTACPMTKLETHARHYWSGGAKLDFFSDTQNTADAIAAFAGTTEAKAYLNFLMAARGIHDSLKQPFIKSQRPSLLKLMANMTMGQLLKINPYENLWSALKKQFSDSRLIQLFGRYATYCGTSPFKAPATLMLIAYVETEGVWRIDGGMHRLPEALRKLAEKLGVAFHTGIDVNSLEFTRSRITGAIDSSNKVWTCANIVMNGDPDALAKGFLGQTARTAAQHTLVKEQSLSAFVWCGKTVDATELVHHSVFFSNNYEKEFSQLSASPADDPTVYMCDQSQSRKQFLINSPAHCSIDPARCRTSIERRLAACGLETKLDDAQAIEHTPQSFAELYPGTGGALYGRASNAWTATFQRPMARTPVPGLYLAGGATHPGPGVPMAALSGMRAAEAILQDRASTRSFRKTVTGGGT
jgi:1-hydroxycarotenoid 3,4-desaturase